MERYESTTVAHEAAVVSFDADNLLNVAHINKYTVVLGVVRGVW